MPTHNFWTTMSQAYKAELWPYVKWHGGQTTDPETGDPIPEPVPVNFPTIATITQPTIELFNNIHDEKAIDRLFKSWDAAGRTYKNWSVYVNKPADAPAIRAELDALVAADPNDFSISGAWNYDTGAEVGAGGAGVWYPIPSQIVNFMPDIMTDPGGPEGDPPPTYEPATEPTDVNLLFGQAPRDFSSFYG